MYIYTEKYGSVTSVRLGLAGGFPSAVWVVVAALCLYVPRLEPPARKQFAFRISCSLFFFECLLCFFSFLKHTTTYFKVERNSALFYKSAMTYFND